MSWLSGAWASASSSVRIALIVAVVVVILACLAYGLGIEWFVAFAGG